MGLEEFGKRLDKEAKAKVAFSPDDDIFTPPDIVIGMPAIDAMFGGGIPRGKTSIFVGVESSGKTLLAQLVIAAAQREGGKAVFIDVEHTYSPKWFALTGVQTADVEKLLIIRPTNLEHAFDVMQKVIVEEEPDVLVLDSIAFLVPKSIMDAKMEDGDSMGIIPRKITEGIKKLTAINNTTALIVINQIRMQLGIVYGNPETMPGGKALRNAASLIVRLRRGKWLTDVSAEAGEEDMSLTLDDKKDSARTGFMLKLRVEKSKVSAPWEEAELKSYFDGTIDPLSSFIHMAIKKGLITGGGGYYTVLDEDTKIHGMSNLENRIREDEELKIKLTEMITNGGI